MQIHIHSNNQTYSKIKCIGIIFDPFGQPKVTAGRDHCFRTCSIRPSPLFKSRKTKQQKTMFATVVTMALAEWIIDDTGIVRI